MPRAAIKRHSFRNNVNPMSLKVGAFVSLSVVALLAGAQTGTWIGGIYGEGYSSGGMKETIEFAGRMFSAPMFPALCDRLPAKPTRFEFSAKRIRLHAGEPLSLSKAFLRARDRTGGFVPRVPFNAHVYYEPGVLERDDTSPTGPELVGARPGRAKVVLQALCTDADGRSAQLEIPVVVVP